MRLARALIGAAALLLTAVGAPALAKPAIKAAPFDWSRTVVATPQGGYRMGRPNASVKLVEYGSLVCPHCRHFAETGVDPLVSGYVKSGKVSYEFRPYILSGLDIAATLLATCNGARSFFPIAHDLYAAQPTWSRSIDQAQSDQISSLPESQMYAEFAKATGIGAIAGKRGVSAQRANQCLRDGAAALRLAKIAEVANGLGVTGTPTFFINGRKTDAYDWPSLKPLLGKS
jgi:protein-disulfide isomerase